MNILSAYGLTAADDMTNTIEYYDPETVSIPEIDRTIKGTMIDELTQLQAIGATP